MKTEQTRKSNVVENNGDLLDQLFLHFQSPFQFGDISLTFHVLNNISTCIPTCLPEQRPISHTVVVQ